MQPEPSGGSSSFSEGLCALLKSAGVLKTSVIRVVGGGGMHALLWLCRHGYEQVGFMHGFSPAEPADVVFAPDAGRPEVLDEILTQASHLSPGGLVVLRTRCGAASDLLSQRGFRIERRLRGRHRDVYVARRCATAPLSVAASAG
jgi:hypothetical protein